LILVAFFLPMGLYLIALGAINRHPRPVVVSGTWDAIGLLFAISGFLFLGGPTLLGSLSERWRWFWLLGDRSAAAAFTNQDALGSAGWWLILFGLYFALVVEGCLTFIWGRARLTLLYNISEPQFEAAIAQTAKELGQEIHRSADLLVLLPQTPQDEPLAVRIESVPDLRHVTLCWQPGSGPRRTEFEEALTRQLAHTETPEHDLGPWVSFLGLILCIGSLMLGIALVLRARFPL
jgi:hypothetical protein